MRGVVLSIQAPEEQFYLGLNLPFSHGGFGLSHEVPDLGREGGEVSSYLLSGWKALHSSQPPPFFFTPNTCFAGLGAVQEPTGPQQRP